MDLRVLIVDGNRDDVRLMSEALAMHGFTIDVAPDAERALEALEQCRPDVVLLDSAGPSAGGMQLLDRIRASPHLAATPVIVVTAKARDDDVLEGYKFGADYYVTKPVTARRLLRAVGLVLGREFPE